MQNTTADEDRTIEQALKFSTIIGDLVDIIHTLDIKIDEANKRLENAELDTV